MNRNEIYNMDCLDGLPQIKSRSVKLICADPPYFMGMTHNGQRGSFVDLAICKPFFKQLFKEFKRILTHDGQVYFFSDWRGYAFYYPLFDGELGCRNVIVWDKITGPGSDYSYCHEFILWHAHTSVKKMGTNVWRSPGFGGGAKATNGNKIHPTQKTLEIIERIVVENTAPGDLVVDPFSGSGTTAVVCRKTGRDFIAFELDEVNFDNSIKRAGRPVQSSLLTERPPTHDIS